VVRAEHRWLLGAVRRVIKAAARAG